MISSVRFGNLDKHNAGFVIAGLDEVEMPIADIDTMIRTKQGLGGKHKDGLKILLLKKRKAQKGCDEYAIITCCSRQAC